MDIAAIKKLEAFNQTEELEAIAQMESCCTAMSWCRGMVEGRPYASIDELVKAADEIWATMQEADILEAFSGHPKIGDVNSLRAKYAHTAGLAGAEQGAVKQAPEDVLQALKSANDQYEAQNGFIFIVCATGKSAEEMLEILRARLINDRDTELKIGAGEQSKITEIRLRKLFEQPSGEQ
ncbi:2-oxo-4-hydroxy-4-carboxy-5-ureidoimidazoline decarboxylase [Hahella ganghwensis]|uniref:2-oxo-4-hydroxy-4-carboxy-5-ureidoimidazoline decarboxylase n=1 Tax=Hahella ganghwensis TaxID=286420 RepID=UPI0003A5BB22|nr:2-oxo-4-hydroxy-4-carboxy-5-ureidoimidazoline decarboxylase [Hahella ganghwensis]